MGSTKTPHQRTEQARIPWVAEAVAGVTRGPWSRSADARRRDGGWTGAAYAGGECPLEYPDQEGDYAPELGAGSSAARGGTRGLLGSPVRRGRHRRFARGELLGLRWEDLDLDTGKLAVRRSLDYGGKEPLFQPPKNGKGRGVKLSRRALDAVSRHKAAQNEERLRLGALWEDQGLIFPGRTGNPMRPWSLTGGPYLRLLARAGLPEKTRFHDLRHTCATLLLKKGVHPKYVQELLGHATIAITLDTYSHVLPGMDDGIAESMEEALR